MPRSPIAGPIIITQRFGANPKNYPYTNGHPGVDIRSPLKDDWYSCVPSVYHVINRFYPLKNDPSYGGYGKAIALDWGHADGTFTRFLYGHGNDRRPSSEGQHFPEGTYVAESGNTGHSTAPHLHFEMRWYRVAGRFYDGTLKRYYDLKNPTTFFDANKIPYRFA